MEVFLHVSPMDKALYKLIIRFLLSLDLLVVIQSFQGICAEKAFLWECSPCEPADNSL